MNGRNPRGLTRRKFLFTAGGAASALTFGCSRAPDPGPTVRVTAGNGITPANPSPSVDLPALTLTAADSGTFGWSFGHVFRQGDVPEGFHLAATSGASAFQADIRNFWPDGSVKYAVLSGISNFTANNPTAVQMGTTHTAPSGANVPEPTAAQVENVAVELTPTATSFSISRAMTLHLSDVLGVDLSTWSVNSAGRVRQILGQVMSEFHYYQPVNSLLHVWWYVRAYSNGAIEIERVIENGWWPTTDQTQQQQDYGIASYTNSNSTPDFQMPYFSHQFPSGHYSGTNYYVCQATGELVVVGGGAGDDFSIEPSSGGTGGVPATNTAIYLNGSTSTVYTATTSDSLGPLYSSTATYIPGQFASNSQTDTTTYLYQATPSYPSGTNQPLPRGPTSNTYWTYIGSTYGFAYMKLSGGTLPSLVTSVFEVGHIAFTRYLRVDWIGGAPVNPLHNAAYLRATKMVPNYGHTNPTANSYNGTASTNLQPWASALNPPPYQIGNWTPDLGDAGYQSDIGILPQWEAVYCSASGSARVQAMAYAATISNHRGAGRFAIFRRDPTTGRPVNYNSYPNNTFVEWGLDPSPPTGNNIGVWEGESQAHQPSNGYLPYLIEARWSACEALAFTATHNVMLMRPSDRQGGGTLCMVHPSTNAGASIQPRGLGWGIRAIVQAAAVQPRYLGGNAPATADSTLTASYVQSLANTADWNYGTFVSGTNLSGAYVNRLGWLGQYGPESSGGDYGPADPQTGATITNALWDGHWMSNYQCMALAHACELQPEGMTSVDYSTLQGLRNFVFLNQTLVCGDDSTFSYRSGVGLYCRPYLSSSSTTGNPVFLSIPEQYQLFLSAEGYSDPSAGTSLFYRSTQIPIGPTDYAGEYSKGYIATAVSVLAMAVDAGVSGAQAAYNTATGASNWTPQASGDPLPDDAPQFSFVPRSS
jgi:hypothetical protein